MYMTSTLSFERIEDYDSLEATQDISYTLKIKVFDTLENTSDGSLTLLSTTYSDLLNNWLDFSYDYSSVDESGKYNTIIGTLTGTPSNEHVGDYDISFTAGYQNGANVLKFGYMISVINVNDDPSGIVTIDGIAEQGEILTANLSQLIEPDGLPNVADISFEWHRQNEFGEDSTINNANDISYLLTQGDVGHKIYVHLSYTDVGGSFEEISSNLFPEAVSSYIRDISDAPFFVSVPVEDASVASQYVYNIDVSHSDGYDVSLTAIAPHWLTLTSVGGNDYQWDLSGTPTTDDVGLQEVVLVATDGNRSTTQEYPIKVVNNNNITINCSDLVDISQNVKLDELVSFLYVDNEYSLDISYSKPDWIDVIYISFGNYYEFTGTPSNKEVGSHEIKITASHGYNVKTKTMIINVDNANDVPFFVTSAVDSDMYLYATQDLLFNHTIDVSDVDGVASLDISYVVNGVSNEWLDFSINSLSLDMSGIPSDEYVGLSYEIIVTISDEYAADISQTYILNVISTPPFFTTTPIYSAFVGQSYNYYLDVSHVDPNMVITVSGEKIPSWLTFNETDTNSWDLSGQPSLSDSGPHNVVISVSDDYSTIKQEFTINVTNTTDTAINFVLRGLDTDVDLYEKMDFKDLSSTVIYHHYIARKQVVAASFDFVFWFRCPSGEYVTSQISDNNNDINSIADLDISYAIALEKWNSAIDISYSDFVPDSGIDASYNVIREDISQYYDKNTLGELGVSRMARQVSGSYMNSYVFENRNKLVQQYQELDVSINELIKSKLDNGGSFDVPLSNISDDDDVNITRTLMETMLVSGTSSDRIKECIDDASGGAYDYILNTGNFEGVYPWVPLKFKAGDKLRHRLTYVVESIVNDYSNVNITDNINHISSDQYPDIIYGGSLPDMSSVIITDQHFLIEYEMI